MIGELGLNNPVMVSVVCTTYNHEKYLQTALESVVSQMTDFCFEVIIGDDCSTDRSASIIKSFENKYPEIITAIYRDINIGPSKNLKDLYSRTNGKYVILLETDDFWIDRKKLQKQVDFLENHPDFFEVAHRCIIVDDYGRPRGIQYCECHDSTYTLHHYKRDILPGQTATCMFRNFYKHSFCYKFDLLLNREYEIGPGDKRCAFVMASQVKVACLPDIMSAYRFVEKGGSSFSATSSMRDSTYKVDSANNIMKFAHKCLPENSNSIKCSEYILIREILLGILKRKKGYSFSMLRNYSKDLVYPTRSTICAGLYCFLAIIKKPFHLNATFKKIDSTNEAKLLEEHQKEMMLIFGDNNG